jgi:Zn-dependent protease with chaperone function
VLRLARLALRYGIRGRELPDVRPFCALAGVLAPISVVSSGTVAQLSDAELAAALLHERRHARRGDQVIAALVAFATDLLAATIGGAGWRRPGLEVRIP